MFCVTTSLAIQLDPITVQERVNPSCQVNEYTLFFTSRYVKSNLVSFQLETYLGLHVPDKIS